ncbi:MAG: hypothetical protein JWO71_2306 [Candidatus Acidoferrum typicum]|nr:hypothetical protein [Candidatus Acidoferrum typicum]
MNTYAKTGGGGATNTSHTLALYRLHESLCLPRARSVFTAHAHCAPKFPKVK